MIRVGIVGTSWWADGMYMPTLQNHPQGEFVAVCGRDPQRTREFAARWNVPQAFTDYRAMIDEGKLDAIIVASINDSHYQITMDALDAGLHVLCEKPLGQNVDQAQKMAAKAQETGLKTLVPFTYRYMPTNRYVKQLIDEGYIGKPYHLNMRYYAGYGRESKYDWRFDADVAGAGVVADLGSHWLHLARMFYGEVVGLSCYFDTLTPRPNHPDEGDYQRADDTALITVRFANGAYGVLQVTTLAWEGTSFGQTHNMEFHGSGGTLYSLVDWDNVQQVRGIKAGEKGGLRDLPIPDSIWQGARHDTVHNTYRDVFREQNTMTREFITTIAEDKPCFPDFAEGARVQTLVDAAIQSAKNNCCWVEV